MNIIPSQLISETIFQKNSMMCLHTWQEENIYSFPSQLYLGKSIVRHKQASFTCSIQYILPIHKIGLRYSPSLQGRGTNYLYTHVEPHSPSNTILQTNKTCAVRHRLFKQLLKSWIPTYIDETLTFMIVSDDPQHICWFLEGYTHIGLLDMCQKLFAQSILKEPRSKDT